MSPTVSEQIKQEDLPLFLCPFICGSGIESFDKVKMGGMTEGPKTALAWPSCVEFASWSPDTVAGDFFFVSRSRMLGCGTAVCGMKVL